MNSKYDSYSSSSSSGNDGSSDNTELLYTPEASFEATVGRVFGSESQYGQSLGVVYEDVEITDGCLYYDTEKDKFKLFSWKKATGMSPADAIDRGTTLGPDDADEVMNKTYVGNDKTYDLVAVVIEEVTDEDGEVLIEAASESREVATPGEADFTEWENHGGDPVSLDGDYIVWYDGSSEYGPSTSSTQVAEILTEYGEDMITDEDDIHGWLRDTSGNDVLRSDLKGTRVEHFKTTQQSDESGFNYHVPHFIDVETGIEVVPDNTSDDTEEAEAAAGGGSGNSSGGSALVQSSTDSYSEPLANFINSAQSLELNPERANELLDDMIADTDTLLTEDMLSEAGGRGAVVEQVV